MTEPLTTDNAREAYLRAWGKTTPNTERSVELLQRIADRHENVTLEVHPYSHYRVRLLLERRYGHFLIEWEETDPKATCGLVLIAQVGR